MQRHVTLLVLAERLVFVWFAHLVEGASR